MSSFSCNSVQYQFKLLTANNMCYDNSDVNAFIWQTLLSNVKHKGSSTLWVSSHTTELATIPKKLKGLRAQASNKSSQYMFVFRQLERCEGLDSDSSAGSA